MPVRCWSEGRSPAGSRRLRRGVAAVSVGLAAVVLAVAVAVVAVAANPASDQIVGRGWEALSRLLFREAHDHFTAAQPTREARYGQAMALINLQPKTRDNVATAIVMLRELIADDPDDPTGIAARYFLARTQQLHPFETDVDRALELFDQLIADHPHHYLGEMALVKSGMLRLYAPEAGDRRAELFVALEAAGAKLGHDDAIRDFHLMMADAAGRRGLGQAAALEHLLIVLEVGVATRNLEADLHVRIGELARLTDRPALAAEHYRALLEKFPRDARRYMIEQRLDQVAGERDPAPADAASSQSEGAGP